MKNKLKTTSPTSTEGCQLPCLPKFAEGIADHPDQSAWNSLKRSLAYPWNNYVKKMIKKVYFRINGLRGNSIQHKYTTEFSHSTPLQKGDLVRVRSREDILRTLDPFKELKGCAFLAEMHQYCGTQQRIFKTMERFLDERDYKVKKTRGLVLLENNFCTGTPAFGKCDRSCFLFWREEWLEKIEG